MPLAAPVTAAAAPWIAVICRRLHVEYGDNPYPGGRLWQPTMAAACHRFRASCRNCGPARMLELSGAFMAKVMTWLRRAFAGGFAALGARLAFAER